MPTCSSRPIKGSLHKKLVYAEAVTATELKQSERLSIFVLLLSDVLLSSRPVLFGGNGYALNADLMLLTGKGNAEQARLLRQHAGCTGAESRQDLPVGIGLQPIQKIHILTAPSRSQTVNGLNRHGISDSQTILTGAIGPAQLPAYNGHTVQGQWWDGLIIDTSGKFVMIQIPASSE